MSPISLSLFVKYDVAAFEQRVHRVAHDIDGTVALGQVGDVDEIDGPRLRVIGEERHQARRPFYGVEGTLCSGSVLSVRCM